MEHKKTCCQAPPEAPGLCANKCGFFGSAATMNLCSKCHMELLMKKREQTEVLASSSITSTAVAKDPNVIAQDLLPSYLNTDALENAKESPKRRCTTCKKRVGLTGFNCRCGDVFCAVHRYSDKHGCTYDYLSAARRAIANANPVIKAKKLDKI